MQARLPLGERAYRQTSQTSVGMPLRCQNARATAKKRGAKSMLGGILNERNWSYLNAGPRPSVAVIGDNGDIEFTQKYLILDSTHEKDVDPEVRENCLSARSNKDMLLDMQSGQAMAVGCMGGYTMKYPILGQKEAERLGHEECTGGSLHGMLEADREGLGVKRNSSNSRGSYSTGALRRFPRHPYGKVRLPSQRLFY